MMVENVFSSLCLRAARLRPWDSKGFGVASKQMAFDLFFGLVRLYHFCYLCVMSFPFFHLMKKNSIFKLFNFLPKEFNVQMSFVRTRPPNPP
ncbi:MAG: hypothetical protein FWF96_02215, partial [Kiritimatiellaeota bacterium]|nr:hypothetical protein [Kiritimatiellota bacterium]